MSENIESIARAIYETAQAYSGGAKALAQKVGAQPGTFSNKCNPHMKTHVLNIEEARAMMRETGDMRLLDALARECKHVCVPIDDYSGTSDMELLDAWADWDGERSETVLLIKNALADRNITAHEISEIHKEMFEDFKMELALLERLKALVG